MISVVLPSYNESETLPATVEDIHSYLAARDEEYEILIVENGSSDNTAHVGRELREKFDEVFFFHESLADYGNALRRGFREAHGDIVVNFDVDFYDVDFLERAVTIIRDTKNQRPSIVVGSKRTIGAKDERPVL